MKFATDILTRRHGEARKWNQQSITCPTPLLFPVLKESPSSSPPHHLSVQVNYFSLCLHVIKLNDCFCVSASKHFCVFASKKEEKSCEIRRGPAGEMSRRGTQGATACSAVLNHHVDYMPGTVL